MNMVDPKSWEEFQATGLLWWINALLHTFGWAIIVEEEADGKIVCAYPARVKFRGFTNEVTEEGHRKVAAYLKDTAAELDNEARS